MATLAKEPAPPFVEALPKATKVVVACVSGLDMAAADMAIALGVSGSCLFRERVTSLSRIVSLGQHRHLYEYHERTIPPYIYRERITSLCTSWEDSVHVERVNMLANIVQPSCRIWWTCTRV